MKVNIKEEKITTRNRLINCAAKIFAEKGYTNATTREICLAAETNITSIHYYFKDKAGLYRTIFLEPFKDRPELSINIDQMLNNSIHGAFYYFYKITVTPFLGVDSPPLPHTNDGKVLNSLVHELMKQEQSLSTGLVDDLIIGPARNVYDPLTGFICHHLKLDAPTEEVYRIAFAIGGMTFSLLTPKRIVEYYAINLLNSNTEMHEQMFLRLADFATAILETEIKRESESNNKKK